MYFCFFPCYFPILLGKSSLSFSGEKDVNSTDGLLNDPSGFIEHQNKNDPSDAKSIGLLNDPSGSNPSGSDIDQNPNLKKTDGLFDDPSGSFLDRIPNNAVATMNKTNKPCPGMLYLNLKIVGCSTIYNIDKIRFLYFPILQSQ